MDTCHHCEYSEAHFLMKWHYPDAGYHLAAALCWACSEQVRIRGLRGLLVVDEDQDLKHWNDPVLERLYLSLRTT